MSSMKSENWEQYLKTLLECPVCLQTIESLPIFQCCNGHIVCKDCLQRLDNCPVCRNEPICIRNLQLEQLIEKKDRYVLELLFVHQGTPVFPSHQHALGIWICGCQQYLDPQNLQVQKVMSQRSTGLCTRCTRANAFLELPSRLAYKEKIYFVISCLFTLLFQFSAHLIHQVRGVF